MMGASSSIEWTDATWNPVRGCSRVSPGCERCYAEQFAARFAGAGLPYEGLARRTADGEPRWTGKVKLIPEHLDDPLRWTRPRRIFVNSMSDLFHESLGNEEIAAIFGVMAAANKHTFQVLTKRPERMLAWFAWVDKRAEDGKRLFPDDETSWRIHQMLNVTARRAGADVPSHHGGPWPLPNVCIGVSVEDQPRADERVPLLRATPAAVRFLSIEPQLRLVDLRPHLPNLLAERLAKNLTEGTGVEHRIHGGGAIHWVIVGGESGHGARPFDLAWARDIVSACKGAGVPCFIKQLGAHTIDTTPPGRTGYPWRDRKGGDMSEWPADLRVRQLPEVAS